MPAESYGLAYGLFRVAWVALALLGCLWLWRRPRAGHAFALILGLHLIAWLAYRLPLYGSYGLSGNDRRFAVGFAACVAAGNSPWGGYQVGAAAVEPFWDMLIAALALFDPARVMAVFDWLSPLAIICVACGLFFGLRGERPQSDAVFATGAWDRVLPVLAVLGLSSSSLSNRTPVAPFFAGNFLLKPNHAMGYGVFALALGVYVSSAPFWLLGLVLALLSWVFILHWAYALPVLVLAELLRPRAQQRWARLAGALAISSVLALPQILNLARDYSPADASDLSRQMWHSAELSTTLAQPHWMTLDLGLLLVLAAIGTLVLVKRRTRLDCGVLATVVFAFVANAGQTVLAPFGIAPEVDELHYFLRFAAALAAGVGLAAVAQQITQCKGLAGGRGHALVLAACIPLTFPAYWDPPTMDKYFDGNVHPLPSKIVACADWIRAHTPHDAVFVASFEPAQLIPALTGRRVLLVGNARPPADYAARRRVIRTLLRERDAGQVRQAAARYGVTHLVVDRDVREEYAVNAPTATDAFALVYTDRNLSIFALRHARPGVEPIPSAQ